MHKKLTFFASGAAMAFGLAILTLSLLAVTNPMRVLPFDETSTGSGLIKTPEKNNYYLPYPGLLPDSPLYRLKALRDKVSLWLTFDPTKKAEKELAYSDKRLNAAIALVDGGKSVLGVSTATKGEKYLEESVSGAIVLQQQGVDDKSLLLTLEKATVKHEAVLQDLILKTPDSGKIILEGTLRTTKMWQEKVSQALIESK